MEFLKHIDFEKVVLYALAVHTALKAYRDAIDTTPETDDNLFEKFVTLTGKVIKYLVGIRAKKTAK